jgi:large subunit ribosomal protein L21
MYAIVDIAGQQFKVQKDQKIFVHRQEGEAGTELNFDKVLLLDNEGKVTVGNPTVENAKITAKILDHVKGDKVIIFKKRRRKGYKLKRGHRQQFTQIQIGEIVE